MRVESFTHSEIKLNTLPLIAAAKDLGRIFSLIKQTPIQFHMLCMIIWLAFITISYVLGLHSLHSNQYSLSFNLC